jgi:MFS family permease
MTPVTPSNMSRTGRPLDGQTPPGLPLSMAGGRNPWVIAFVVSLATFMEVLDTSIANVALAHIAGNLSASLDESTWVLTSYLVSNAVVLPISGWLATVIGRKRFYMGCVALFTISSLLCGLAPSLTWLIIFRVLQGAGGGGLQPSEQSMLADTFPPDKLGMVFALYGVAVVVAPAVGPTLGGWITDNYSWHWVFLINVPVGLLSLSLTYALLATPPGRGAAAGGHPPSRPAHRLHRLRPRRARPGVPAGRAGQGAAGRLVRLDVHHQLHRDRGRGAAGPDRPRTDP